MLDTLFLQIFDMSKVASLVILLVLAVRLCLMRAPKVFSYMLWAIVLFRLLCPVSIEAPVSLIPRTEPTIESYDLLNESVTPLDAFDAAGRAVGDVLNGGIGIQHVRTTESEPDGTRRVISTDFANVWMLFSKYVWIAGVFGMLLYSGVSLVKLRRQLLASVRLHDNIYLADDIATPFVMGIFRPSIYLPSSLSETERGYILLHEQHHIRRGDHIVKLLSFAALCLHWFNPLVWAAFILSGKDMEMSCDEAVLRRLGEDIRADYTASLISLATGRRIIAGTPLAFGEGDAEGRVKNIARWKKPAVWVIAAAVTLCAAAAVCLITNPLNRDTTLLGAEYRVEEVLYHTDEVTPHIDNDAPSVCITADYCLWERNDTGDWELIGQMEPYSLDKKELADYTAYSEGWRRPYDIGEITDSYIYRTDGNLSRHFFLAIRTKSGDSLLGYGTEDVSERGQGASDDTSLHFLLRLESTFGGTYLSGEFHERSLSKTVGGDVEIFHTWHMGENAMIVGFMSDDSPYRDGVQLPSAAKTDMGFAVFDSNRDRSGYRLLQCHVYEDAALAENGVFLCPDPAVLDASGELKPKQTYDVVFVNNKEIVRAERIWNYADGSEKKQGEPFMNGRQMLVYSWENDRAGCRVMQYFYDAQGEVVKYSSIIKEKTVLVEMTPTKADVTGVFDGYLYVPSDGETYRYEIIFDDPAAYTKGELLYSFTEDASPEDVDWHVYAVKEFPDRSAVLAEAGGDYVHLYRYSPSKAVDPKMLNVVKAAGMVVSEDGYVTFGQEIFSAFLKKTQKGKAASVQLAHYHTLEAGNYDAKYREVYSEDYPSLSTFELSYKNGVYLLRFEESGSEILREYKYLRKFEHTLPESFSAKLPRTVTSYVLTDDKTATWDELWRSLLSAQPGDAIGFFTVYSEIQ